MHESLRQYLTVEQIAERWAVDPIDVHQLILTQKLTQGFIIHGPATVQTAALGGRLGLHPLTKNGAVPTCLLVRALSAVTNVYSWPLQQVLHVYEFQAGGRNQPGLLEHACAEARQADTGCMISFDESTTTAVGQDAFKVAREALSDTSLIPVETLLDFETRNGITPQPAVDPPPALDTRDACRQRCRAIAQILWERDPTATIPDLFKHEWVQRIACEGRAPSERTFREWVKDLNPDRRPGRRPR